MTEPLTPRIQALWVRLGATLLTYILATNFAVVLFMSFVFVSRNLNRTANPADIPKPTEEEVMALNAEPGFVLARFVITVMISLCITFLATTLLDRRPLRDLGFSFRGAWSSTLGWGAFLGVILSSLLVLTVCALGGRHLNYVGFADANPALVVGFFLFLILISFAEEWFVRGYIYANLRAEASAARTILMTSLLFSAIHINNPGLGALGWINLYLAGIVLGQLRELTGGLQVSFGLHAAWNIMLGMVMGATLSGFEFPSLFRVSLYDLESPLGGGEFGPEASAIMTFLFLGVIIVLARRLAPPAPEEI